MRSLIKTRRVGRILGVGWSMLVLVSCSGWADEGTCDIGPLNRTFGAAQWLVYACPDHETVVIASAPGNPALPFVFVFRKEKTQYQLRGEGTGSNVVADAAYDELKRFSSADIAALIEQAMRASAKP